MNMGRRHCISTDEAIVDIDTDTVLVAVMVDSDLFDPVDTKSFCRSRSGFSYQPSGSIPALIFLVLVAGIALVWKRDKSGIDDLTAASLQALRTQLIHEPLEEHRDDRRLSQSLSLKKAIVVASRMLFSTPRPTNSSKERLSLA